MTQIELPPTLITPGEITPQSGASPSHNTIRGSKGGAPIQWVISQRFVHAIEQEKSRMTAEFNSLSGQIPQQVQDDVRIFAESSTGDALSRSDQLVQQLRNLIAGAQGALASQTATAHSHFGEDPLPKTGWDFVNAGSTNGRPNDWGWKEWTVSYAAAHTANLTRLRIAAYESKLQEAEQRSAQLRDEAITAARAQVEEAARRLAQQQAEEAARRLAQQQAEEAARRLAQQQAEEAARRLAQQQAEEAARQLAQQQAEEAARQLAQQQAEEAARQLAQQQAEEAARRLAQHQVEEAARQLAQQQAEEAARQLAQQQAEEAARRLAQHQVEEAARQLAQQQAEEAARLELEAQRIRNGYGMPDTTSLAAFSAMGGAAIVVGEASLNALQAAIRTATAGLAAAAVGTSAVLASIVGALTLLWPANVADSERRLSLSVPLKDLAPPEDIDWAALAAQGGSIDLPYVMLNQTHGDQTKIVVAKSNDALVPSKVRVVAAQLDTAKNLYTVQLDSPPRTLVWRPLKDPGADTSSSTALPGEPSKPLIYSGATLEVIEPHIESYPALDGLGVEQIIVDFPIDSGLERVLIMFKDRRLEPGVASGNGGDIEKLWLGEQSQGLGARIPTRIADQLRDREFKNFNQFREEFWKTVALDVELSAQFSKANLSGMTKAGYAPNVRTVDQHKSLDTYVLHHTVPISEGGGVYDIDNIRIVTPKAHHAIHYKEGK